MPTPFTRRFGVLMDNDEPFEFDWDREEEPTKAEVRDLWQQSLADQTIQIGKEQMEPLEETPFMFKTPEQNLTEVNIGTAPPPVEEPKTGAKAAWDWATTSFLPERKTENPMYGAQTLSRVGDWAYEKLARPAVSPAGAVATAAGAVSIPARIGLAGIGAATGLYNAPEDISEAWENPTFENIADVGLDAAAIAAPYTGYKAGAFTKKPGFEVLGPDVEMPPAIDVTQRRMYPQSGTRGLMLEAKNPIGMGGPPAAEVIPPGPVSRLHVPDVREAALLEVADIGPEAAQRMYPTVGGVGLSNIQALSKTGRPKPGERNRLPRVGGVGEMGIRGEPFFPAIPERVQTSSNQEAFRGVTEMLTRMAQQGKRTTAQPVLSVKSVLEDVPDASNETYFNDRMLRERAAGDEVVPPQVLTDYRPRLNKKGEVIGTGKLFEENPNYPNKPVEPTLPEVEVVNEGRPQPRVDPATQPWGPFRTERRPDVVDKGLADVVRKWAGKSPEVANAAAQTAAERRALLKEDAKATAADIGTSGWTQLDKMGDKGRALSRFVQRVRADSEGQAGQLTKRFRSEIDKVSDADFEHVVDVVERKANLKDPKLAPAVQAVRAMLRESGMIAERSGLRMYDKDGNVVPFKRMGDDYFPHTFEPGRFNVESLINKLLKENPNMTPDQAKFVVENGIKRGERALDPQHMRSLNLEGYKKDKQALMDHVHDIVKRSYEAEKFGSVDTADPNSYISQLISKSENPEQAMRIINKQLGRTPKNMQYESVAHAINKFEAGSKLGLFGITNLNQGAGIGMRANLSSAARGLAQAVKGVSAEETGALASSLNNTLYDTGQGKGMQAMSKVLGWNKSENFLRNWAAHAGKMDAERLFTALKKDPTNQTNRAKLDSLLLEDVDTVLGQKKLTPEQTSRAGFRMSELTQGLVDPADLPPLWSDSALAKVPLMFKRYAFQQTKQLKNLWNDNKTPADKAKMLGKLVALYTAAGEITGDVTTGIKAGVTEAADAATGGDFEGGKITEIIKNRGKKENKNEFDKTLSRFYTKNGINEDMVNRLLEDMGGSYMLGLVGQIAGDASQTNAAARLANTVVGPAVGDAFALVEGASRSIDQESLVPLAKTATQRILPFGYPVAEGLFPKKKKAPKGINPSMPKVKSFF